MSNIDPFGVPPLVEYENCITHDEIVATITEYVKVRNSVPKWKWLLRWKLNLAIAVLSSVDYHIHKKQEAYGGKREEIN
jgi:hypothetical protein